MRHGLTGDRDSLLITMCWQYFAWSDDTRCSVLEVSGFEHLLIVFPSSLITEAAGDTAWGDDILDGTTFDQGIDNLEKLMCGSTTFFSGGPCTSGYLKGSYG